ncbi:MAG: hypothetical protein WC821_00780 [archaeon]|jgi:hypothetical protein
MPILNKPNSILLRAQKEKRIAVKKFAFARESDREVPDIVSPLLRRKAFERLLKARRGLRQGQGKVQVLKLGQGFKSARGKARTAKNTAVKKFEEARYYDRADRDGISVILRKKAFKKMLKARRKFENVK